MELPLDEMAEPVSVDSPAGENQEYNPLYLALEELACGVPASQMGDSVNEGREPDWRTLRKNCLELWKSTRDLRVACYLAVAGLALDGLRGFAEGLELVRVLFADYWDSFWPQLDPDDDNDPLERLNIVSMISPPPGAYDDPLHFLTLFRHQRLAPAGPGYTLRDLMIADGELESDEKTVDLALLNAEMTAVPSEDMLRQAQLVEEVQEKLTAVAQIFESHTDRYALSFALLKDELKRLKRFYAQFSLGGSPAAGEEGVPEERGAVPDSAGRAETAAGGSAGKAVDLTVIRARNRSEALLLLKKGCEYFQSAEPTSPVPYLISRALRMAEMNFMDLLAEIDASAVERGRDILGVKAPEPGEES